MDKILRGTPAGELPIEQFSNAEFVVNLRAAKERGLSIPDSIRIQATRTID